MFKQLSPGLYLLIGTCLLSAVLQTLHLVDREKVLASHSHSPFTLSRCDCVCDACRPAIRPTR
jgi:hypothetical protein